MKLSRKTKSLEKIMNLFNNSSKAYSAVELISMFNSQMNKTTIYRILEKLQKRGILHSFVGIKGIKWYAKCKGCSSQSHFDAHPHFQCKLCGNLDCLSLDIQIPNINNRTIESAQILVFGKCEKC